MTLSTPTWTTTYTPDSPLAPGSCPPPLESDIHHSSQLIFGILSIKSLYVNKALLSYLNQCLRLYLRLGSLSRPGHTLYHSHAHWWRFKQWIGINTGTLTADPYTTNLAIRTSMHFLAACLLDHPHGPAFPPHVHWWTLATHDTVPGSPWTTYYK